MSLDSPARRRPATVRLHSSIFEEAAGIIAAELDRPLTVDGLARRVASSPRQLRRAFSHAGGTSFRGFLTKLRIDRAAELLVSTEAPVAEVARSVGYREHSQFTKAFARIKAATPSQFRTRRTGLRQIRH